MAGRRPVAKEKSVSINEFSLFAPKTSKGLFFDYPELRDFAELKTLSKRDILFVWFFACEVSPLAMVSGEESRALSSLQFVEEKFGKYPDATAKAYKNLNFPAKINEAIKRMSAFRVGVRIRAKMMIEKTMRNYEDIVSMDINGEDFFSEDGIDFDKQKKYVDATSVIMKHLPILIQQAETGFSVTKKGDDRMDDDMDSFMDDYHEHND